MPITTVDRCKAFRDIPSENVDHDAELERLIPAVQTFLEAECGRVFDSGSVTEFFDGDDWGDLVLLNRLPITGITNIWDDPTRVFATPLAATSYEIHDAKAGIVRLLDGLRFSAGRRNIKITYTGGFTTMPLDLEQAAIEMVWAARTKGVHDLVGVRSRSVADGNIQFVNLDWGSGSLGPVIQKYKIATGVA